MTAAIELAGVAQRFGAVEALGPVDLTIESGEIVTVLGPSGSGKTTLLRIVGGLVEPTAGSVSVDGSSPHVARDPRSASASCRSPLPCSRGAPSRQTPACSWTSTAVVRTRRTAQRLRNCSPMSASRTSPAPYPHELSGGMQQRVALVRAVALGAPLLLMDEPFAALDEITRADMRHLLARLCEPLATTVLFVTHSIAESVFISDRVAVLSARPGRIVGIETIDLARPRQPEIEDQPSFFTLETRLRALLVEGAGR